MFPAAGFGAQGERERERTGRSAEQKRPLAERMGLHVGLAGRRAGPGKHSEAKRPLDFRMMAGRRRGRGGIRGGYPAGRFRRQEEGGRGGERAGQTSAVTQGDLLDQGRRASPSPQNEICFYPVSGQF